MKNFKKMKLRLNSNQVVNCRTKEENEECCRLAKQLKLTFADGSAYYSKVWEFFKENTCYDFFNGTYMHLDDASQCQVLTAQEFLVMHSELYASQISKFHDKSNDDFKCVDEIEPCNKVKDRTISIKSAAFEIGDLVMRKSSKNKAIQPNPMIVESIFVNEESGQYYVVADGITFKYNRLIKASEYVCEMDSLKKEIEYLKTENKKLKKYKSLFDLILLNSETSTQYITQSSLITPEDYEMIKNLGTMY